MHLLSQPAAADDDRTLVDDSQPKSFHQSQDAKLSQYSDREETGKSSQWPSKMENNLSQDTDQTMTDHSETESNAQCSIQAAE